MKIPSRRKNTRPSMLKFSSVARVAKSKKYKGAHVRTRIGLTWIRKNMKCPTRRKNKRPVMLNFSSVARDVVITLNCTTHAYLASGQLISLLFQGTVEQLFENPLL
jgi:hypothetical protein